MKKLRAALRLHKNGHGKRSIAKTCGISKATVKKYINLFNAQGIEWTHIKQMDDKALFDLFTTTTKDTTNPKLKELRAFFPYVHKELRKKGVTRKLLWEE